MAEKLGPIATGSLAVLEGHQSRRGPEAFIFLDLSDEF